MESSNLSQLIYLLYGSVASSNFQPFLQLLADITKSNKAFISLKKITDDSPLFINTVFNFDYSPAALIAYQQRHLEDPLFEVVRYLPEGEIVSPTEVIEVDSYKSSEFYHLILAPLRSHHALGMVVIRDENYDSSLVINRGPDDSPYEPDCYQLLTQLGPHVQQAMRLFTLFRDISQQQEMLKVVLNQSDKALLVLDADANIQLSNAPADRILALLPYWTRQGNRFQLCLSAEQLRFRALLKQCLHAELLNQERLYLQLSTDDTNMQVTLTLAPLRWLELENGCDNLCLLTINYQQAIGWYAVKTEYGLTSRELELVQALHNNQKLTELSAQMQISYHTLRKHLQTIFAKCRVNSQSELMLLLGQFRH